MNRIIRAARAAEEIPPFGACGLAGLTALSLAIAVLLQSMV
jgi:hypothetical protein